jgi:hypothetical protein
MYGDIFCPQGAHILAGETDTEQIIIHCDVFIITIAVATYARVTQSGN